MATRRLDRDLIAHACARLTEVAEHHVRAGLGPANAARAAILETKMLFPADWRLAVQGDDDDAMVEVWEVEHKRTSPCAQVSREPVPARGTSKTRRAGAARRGRSHSTISDRARWLEGDPASWPVAMDAILSEQPEKAAEITRALKKEFGSQIDPPPKFHHALLDVPFDVQARYFAALGPLGTAHKHVVAIERAIHREKDPDALIAAVRVANAFRKRKDKGDYDPKDYELGNLLVDANERVANIKKAKKKQSRRH